MSIAPEIVGRQMTRLGKLLLVVGFFGLCFLAGYGLGVLIQTVAYSRAWAA